MKLPWVRKKEIKKALELEQRIEFFKLITQHFEENAKHYKSFVPEFQISKEILDIIMSSHKEQIDKNLEIVNAFNKIVDVEHYDGSAWYDFKIRLSSYLGTLGYSTHFSREDGTMTIQKA